MKRNESRMTWAIIIGLILVGAFASAVWPTISARISGRSTVAINEPAEPIVIDIESYLLGKEILGLVNDFGPDAVKEAVENFNGTEVAQPVAIGVLSAIAIGSMVLLAGPLALIYTRLEKTASTVKEDEQYQLAVSALDKQQTAELKEIRQASPTRITGDEVQDRRGFNYTMAFLGIIFAWVIGTTIGHAMYGGEMLVSDGGQLVNPVSIVTTIVLVVALALFFLYFRFVRKPEEIDLSETDNKPVSWGWLWVVVSGALIVGIGTGLAVTLTSGGPG